MASTTSDVENEERLSGERNMATANRSVRGLELVQIPRSDRRDRGRPARPGRPCIGLLAEDDLLPGVPVHRDALGRQWLPPRLVIQERGVEIIGFGFTAR